MLQKRDEAGWYPVDDLFHDPCSAMKIWLRWSKTTAARALVVVIRQNIETTIIAASQVNLNLLLF